ncbi:putative colanic acid biosysnthesis UDP-glucose lipid carrier transferase [Flavobacterium degerlachei]|jgi:putative colanic acid biosynthesis UDP-glucose lipid carrier transferase|uniref:Putative colanic acid biosysnthesis UDP-glucose lipid carrier transferase n=2 Tax=Flavobacterium degerlachei TaxID=229203 RepID=A0A1H2QXZ7_9FLAO|nr:putative colanic acid biosysnthesis UDP-glucose lipid carrier transferase [Flavobacterium degerlachei]
MDLCIISVLGFFLFEDLKINLVFYLIYQGLGWIVIAFLIKFYGVYRFTKPIEIISKIIKQGVLFLLIVIAFFPFSDQAIFNAERIGLSIVCSLILITISKLFLFYCLIKYRLIVGNNRRYAVIVGYTPESIQLKELFETRKDYGYQFLGYFSDKKINPEIKGNLLDFKSFSIANQVDEIYCSLSEVSNSQLKDLVEFADENNKTIKFIPDTKEIFSKNLKVDFYDFFPVLSLKDTLLNEPTIKIFKRFFDIIFSLIVIIGVLSWLAPLLAILIKLESKGPIMFKQGRPGIGEKPFNCYKFRSMQINAVSETEASKDDPRVTKIGKLMRKSSIDEMPQFVNVLFGDMSIVGPRPHLWSQNKTYGGKIKKYMKRHYVKPGITGLAQVSGYRGEIETEKDMINRIKMDVFYIENWSVILDLKIIYMTIVNILKGDKKAY